MRTGLWTICLAASALMWTGCPHAAPTPALATHIQIPPGCERDLSGEYAYAGRPDWRYDAVDDGGTLVLELRRALDSEPTSRADAGPSTVDIVLMRTPQGFVGGVEQTAFPAPGAACPIVFDTAVTDCSDAGLALSSVQELAVDESCRPAPTDGGLVRRAHALVLVPRTAEDSGSNATADAGSSAR